MMPANRTITGLLSVVAMYAAVAASSASSAAGLPKLTDEQLQKVAAIEHNGIGFATTLTEFLERFPDAKPTRPIAGGANGVSAYELPDDAAADHVIIAFWGQELIEIGYVFEADRIAKNGDGFILLDRAIARFGRPTRVADASAHWEFPTIDRTVRSKASSNEWWLRICRSSTWQKLPQAQPLAPSLVMSTERMKRRGELPEETLLAIRKNARLEHPGEPKDQAHFVETQVAAFEEVARYAPEGIPPSVVERLKQQFGRSYRNNFVMQLEMLKEQTKGYWGLQDYVRPESIAQGSMYRLREQAARDYPDDYAMQLFSLDQRISEIENR